jgi:hypothetical protein
MKRPNHRTARTALRIAKRRLEQARKQPHAHGKLIDTCSALCWIIEACEYWPPDKQ